MIRFTVRSSLAILRVVVVDDLVLIDPLARLCSSVDASVRTAYQQQRLFRTPSLTPCGKKPKPR